MQTNLEYYKIFYYVSKYNSISLAAEALSISQPAVSQAVKHLESDLSCALFVRTSKGVRLTKEGGLLAEYVRKGYETILTGEKKLSEMLNLDAGEICVGASDMTLQFYLLPYLETFHDAFPQIKVTVTNAPTPETLKHLQDGKIDFGIISTPVNNKYDFKMTPVRKIQDVFVAGKKFEYLKGGKLSYKELENLPVMCLEGSTSTRKYVEDYLAERGTFVRPEFELATTGRYRNASFALSQTSVRRCRQRQKNYMIFCLFRSEKMSEKVHQFFINLNRISMGLRAVI